jgi:hypothetical protein
MGRQCLNAVTHAGSGSIVHVARREVLLNDYALIGATAE